MTWTKHDYDDIPGTYVFDGTRVYQIKQPSIAAPTNSK